MPKQNFNTSVKQKDVIQVYKKLLYDIEEILLLMEEVESDRLKSVTTFGYKRKYEPEYIANKLRDLSRQIWLDSHKVYLFYNSQQHRKEDI